MFIHSSVCAHVFRGRVSKRLCEVAFTEWTGDGRIRHPSFEGLREDKDASQVQKEQPMQTVASANADGEKKTTGSLVLTTVQGLRARVREQRKDEAKILFPSARGGRLSHDSVQYLVAKCAKSAAKSCVTLRK
jgi:bifunctional non-homologous end joining protein LigD